MYKILLYFGPRQLNPLWITLVVISLLLLALAQSYASAKKMKMGPALILSLGMLIVGNVIAYFLYQTWFAERFPPNYTFEHIAIYSYGFMLMLAFVVGTIYLIIEGKKESPPVEADTILDLVVFIIIGSIMGARFIYVILNWNEMFKDNFWNVFLITQGGLSIHGGLLGALFFGWLYIRAKGLDYWKITDLAMPAVALGQVIGRIGCTLNGCCFGRQCDADYALGIVYPSAETWIARGKSPELANLMDAGDAAVGAYARHPIQLYEAFGCLIIFFYLLSFRKNKVFNGHVFLMYVWLYSIVRFIVENFRYMSGDDATTGSSVMIWHTLTQAQLASIILAVIAFLLMVDLKRRAVLSKMLKKKAETGAGEVEIEAEEEEEYEDEEEVIEDVTIDAETEEPEEEEIIE